MGGAPASCAEWRMSFGLSKMAHAKLMNEPAVVIRTYVIAMDSFRGSSDKIGTIQRRLAWPLREDDTHTVVLLLLVLLLLLVVVCRLTP